MHTRFVVLALFVAGCPTRFPDDREIDRPQTFETGPDFGSDGMPAPPLASQPKLGALVSQQTPPPPISGGTLAILKDTKLAVASDPDRDRLFIVDLGQRKKIAEVALTAGDQPGRIVEDYSGRVHVVLRGGALLTISNRDWANPARRDVCPEPRGLAYQQDLDVVHVACAGGELVTLPASGGGATRTVSLGSDLRDVVVNGNKVLVTRFRSAEVLAVNADGTIGSITKPAMGSAGRGLFSPGAAWRTIAAPTANQVFMLHQRGLDGTVETEEPGAYGSADDPCSAIVQSTVSSVTAGQAPVAAPALSRAVLAVDVAFSPSTLRLAVVAAGNAYNEGEPTVLEITAPNNRASTVACDFAETEATVEGEPTAAAYDSEGELYVQTREPAAIAAAFSSTRIVLSAESRADSGHAIFHANAGGQMACASCHMEGGEDGRTWTFRDSGKRRTQSLRGGVLGTEPFHWSGDQKDLATLMHGVFEQRMSGPRLDDDYFGALGAWIDRVPLLRHAAAADPASVARGKELFDNGAQCASCHSGERFTDNSSSNVNTGEAFQVPALRGVVFRGPFLHDGRAKTLRDRFTIDQGSDKHGKISHLSTTELDDLIAYLETL